MTVGLFKLLATTAALAFGYPCFAQNVVNVDGVGSTATKLLSEGRYHACGLRFVGIDLTDRLAFPAYGWDFNISMMRGNSDAKLLGKVSPRRWGLRHRGSTWNTFRKCLQASYTEYDK